MKQTSKMWIGMTVLAFASSAVTGAVIKNTTTNEAPAPIFAPSPVATAAPGGFVDLTSAAESSVPSVLPGNVHYRGCEYSLTDIMIPDAPGLNAAICIRLGDDNK